MPRFLALFILASAAAVSVLTFGWFAGAALAQEPGAGCRELVTQPPTTGRRVLHTPYPCSRFDAPAAGTVLTGTVVSVRGTSSANCEPTRQGVPTRVEKVEVAIGAPTSWQELSFQPYESGCFARWQGSLILPAADNLTVTLFARTTSFHGLPEVFTLYPEDPPTQLALRVDNIPPRVELQLPAVVVGTQFAGALGCQRWRRHPPGGGGVRRRERLDQLVPRERAQRWLRADGAGGGHPGPTVSVPRPGERWQRPDQPLDCAPGNGDPGWEPPGVCSRGGNPGDALSAADRGQVDSAGVRWRGGSGGQSLRPDRRAVGDIPPLGSRPTPSAYLSGTGLPTTKSALASGSSRR
ncbi:MAG: hypothetical protein KatS3mg061_0663 [Dehalococcoidia bacterium]|nr:MAG: hypothetical protein KatS3mg061_0663 [Dehalococcoidia bacterium]